MVRETNLQRPEAKNQSAKRWVQSRKRWVPVGNDNFGDRNDRFAPETMTFGTGNDEFEPETMTLGTETMCLERNR
jgi:hypothetical protein